MSAPVADVLARLRAAPPLGAPLADVLSRLRAADDRARAGQAGGTQALLAVLHRQLRELAAPRPDDSLADLISRR